MPMSDGQGRVGVPAAFAHLSGYEPGIYVARPGRKPVLMLVAEQDEITFTDLALQACECAVEPKKLVMLPGGHFDVYASSFDRASRAAIVWFRQPRLRTT